MTPNHFCCRYLYFPRRSGGKLAGFSRYLRGVTKNCALSSIQCMCRCYRGSEQAAFVPVGPYRFLYVTSSSVSSTRTATVATLTATAISLTVIYTHFSKCCLSSINSATINTSLWWLSLLQQQPQRQLDGP